MDSKLLEDIGLTEGEAKVYLALLKLGESKTGVLASTAEVSSSKVYKILSRLEKKGLAGHVLRGDVKFFSAVEPKRILDYMDEKQEQLTSKRNLVEKMLPELERRQRTASQRSEASVYDGVKGVTNFFRNILDELKPEDTYYVIGAGYGEVVPDLRNFFYLHHKRRYELKIRIKMLANYETKNNLVKTAKFRSEIRFLPQYLIGNTEIVFYKNKVFIAIFTKEPKGFLIENDEAVKSFKSYFEVLWKVGKS